MLTVAIDSLLRPVSSIKELLENSNYVILAVSATPENVKMIGKEELSWMKAGSYLINTSYNECVSVCVTQWCRQAAVDDRLFWPSLTYNGKFNRSTWMP